MAGGALVVGAGTLLFATFLQRREGGQRYPKEDSGTLTIGHPRSADLHGEKLR